MIAMKWVLVFLTKYSLRNLLGMKWVFKHQHLQMFGYKLNKYREFSKFKCNYLAGKGLHQ